MIVKTKNYMYTALFCKSFWPVNNSIRYFIQLCDMVFFQCDQPTANFKVISLLLNPTPLLKQDMSVDRPCCPINISRTFAGRTSDLVNCSPYKVEDTVDYNVTGTTAKVQTTLKRLHPVDLALFTQYLYFFFVRQTSNLKQWKPLRWRATLLWSKVKNCSWHSWQRKMLPTDYSEKPLLYSLAHSTLVQGTP